MTPLSIFVILYSYAAVLIFIVGSILMISRWVFKKKGPSDTYLGYPYLSTYSGQNSGGKALKNMLSRILLFSSARDDPFIRYTSLAFHWTLWIIVLAHLDMVTMPYFVAWGIPERVISALGAYLGTALAFVMVAAGLFLLGRRLMNPYMRRISNASDYFSIVLIICIGISGIIMRLVLPDSFAYDQVAPFIISLVHFSPVSPPLSYVFLSHFLLTLSLFIYFPLSKLIHPFSFFTNPTMYSTFHQGGNK